MVNHNFSLYEASMEPLSKAEELDLAEKASSGNKQAREKLIRANIRYALSYAKTFYGHGLPNEEVNEEAVIGLIKAIDHFDFKRGTKVITLAKMYIMNEIVSACNKSGYAQRQSNERLRMILKINKAMRKIHRDYSHSELLDVLSVKTGLTQQVIAELLEETMPSVSLDEPSTNEIGETRLSLIPDNVSCSPEETAIYRIQVQQLYKSLEKLEPIEKQIICMSSGLQEYKQPYSLSEIGKELGESKQYIHYLKQRALTKLRTNMCGNAA